MLGFLGAGKTTLLKHILEGSHGRRVAVIVNDMAALNIDAALVKQNGFVQVKPEVVEMQNGCICCTLRQDLVREIQRLSEMQCFDYLVIESTGIAEPMHVAESFVFALEENKKDSVLLSDLATLDTCVTVVDCFEFASNALSIQSVKEKFNEADENEEDKDIGHLLIDQIEFADVIVINKVDLTSAEEAKKCEEAIRLLNPSARIVKSVFSNVDLSAILNTGLFQLEQMQRTPGWLSSLRGGSATVTAQTSLTVQSESEEYGIGNFVYRSRRPFHPARLMQWIQTHFLLAEEVAALKDKAATTLAVFNETRKQQLLLDFGVIYRSKGFCWIAGERESIMVEWEQAGRVLSLVPIGNWFSDRDESELTEQFTAAEREVLQQSFCDGTDRRQELVFIGSSMNQERITASLDALLLTEEELRGQEAHCMDPCQRVRQHHLISGSVRSFASPLDDPLPLWRSTLLPGPVSIVVPSESMRLLLIPEGSQLTLSNAALEGDGDHQVWLQWSTLSKPTLSCVLRSGKCEQVNLNLVFGAIDADLELDILITNTLTESDTHQSKSRVHILGFLEYVADEEETEHGEEEKK